MPLWTPPHMGLLETSFTDHGGTGVTITASATTHTKGSWAQIIAATAKDAFGVLVSLENVATPATNTAMLVDIGIGGAGSEQVLIPDINAGAANSVRNYGKTVFFPISIPAGSRISGRAQAVIGSDTVNVRLFLVESPPGPIWAANTITAYGVVSASSRGTLVTSGTAGEGAWTEIVAATSRDHQALLLIAAQGGDTTLSGDSFSFDVGAGASAAEVALFEQILVTNSSAEDVSAPMPPFPLRAPVASGTRLAVRGQTNGAAGNEVLDVVLYAID